MNKVVKLASRIIISGAPFTMVAVHAQTAEPPTSQVDPVQQNADALRIWRQQSGSVVELTPGPDGSTKIEFHGGITTDLYHNSIQTPAGASTLYSPLQSGTFFKVVSQGDLRETSTQGSVTYAQATITKSDDRSVLSHYNSQLSNFQLGHTDLDYQMMFGDVAVNFSQLSSSLGLRGFSGVKQLDTYTLSGHMGVITESWESLMDKGTLDGSPARTRYSRDVYGLKLENTFSPNMKAYLTTQKYNDQEGSLTAGSFMLPANAHSTTTGFTYQEGQFSVNGESAVSRYGEKDQTMRRGHATVLDSTYRMESIGWRTGFHDLSASYASLSQMVQPGIKEGYVGLDWTTTTWLTLGTEYRNSKQRTPSYTLVTAQTSTSIVGTTTSLQALTSRANINFGPDLPGWGLALQDTHGVGTDAQGLATSNSNLLFSLNYNSQTWNGMASVGNGRVKNESNPQSDTASKTWQLQLGRQITNGNNESAATWSANTSITAGRQEQDLINLGTSTISTSYGLVFALQRVRSLQFNSSITDNITTQTTGGPNLKSRAVQLEGVVPFGAPMPSGLVPGNAKMYLRDNIRNFGDATLRTSESVLGLQVNYVW
jgi:hypothetical protein